MHRAKMSVTSLTGRLRWPPPSNRASMMQSRDSTQAIVRCSFVSSGMASTRSRQPFMKAAAASSRVAGFGSPSPANAAALPAMTAAIMNASPNVRIGSVTGSFRIITARAHTSKRRFARTCHHGGDMRVLRYTVANVAPDATAPAKAADRFREFCRRHLLLDEAKAHLSTWQFGKAAVVGAIATASSADASGFEIDSRPHTAATVLAALPAKKDAL